MPLVTTSEAAQTLDAFFQSDVGGRVRHWLVAGPREMPYAGPIAPDHIMRRDAPDVARAEPPVSACAGAAGPFGLSWEFHYAGRNDFIEFSTFYRQLTVVEHWAATEIIAPADGVWRGRFWAAGAADLWVNGGHVARLNVTRYRNPDCAEVALPVRRGVNFFCVRLQCLGVRDTRILFGLQLHDAPDASIRLAGLRSEGEAARWLDSVRGDGNHGLVADVGAPSGAVVVIEGKRHIWAAGAKALSFGAKRPAIVEVVAEVGDAVLQRSFEFSGNRPVALPPAGDRRAAHLDVIARAGTDGVPAPQWNAVVLPLLARRLLGRVTPGDADAFAAAVSMVDGRTDCADFVLAGLLRLQLLGLAAPGEAAEIERAALAFRYWTDEPGGDAMCFHSENHSLLFHGCQWLAGWLYAGKVFGNSGRGGAEQVALARERVVKWLGVIEARGFEEFNSSTYMPITIAAMLNVVDFCGDAGIAARMSAQIDRIYRDMARHAFAGGIITPQGRVYRDVLFPEETGTQVLLSLAVDDDELGLTITRSPRERTGDWAVFPASSRGYRPPPDLIGLIHESASMTYRHADVQIILEKTRAYLLTSLAVPAVPREGEHPDNDLRPGGAGYQQHLWQATLGRDCHVFVNHPGGSFDETKSRPGYWYGNGMLPRVRQCGRVLQAIHVIADGSWTSSPPISPDVWEWGSASTVRPYDIHPIQFAHAHWPADAFDREERRGRWVFGTKGRGLIGLWCSEPLTPHDDILTGRELRAEGPASAWMVVCGNAEAHGPLENFMRECEAMAPVFDRANYAMTAKGTESLRWWERPEPMPS